MGYDKTNHSGNCWYVIGSEINKNGLTSRCIYGVSGIGSPHGDLVDINNCQVYNRTIKNFIAINYQQGAVIETFI